jgi:hypothetical protein
MCEHHRLNLKFEEPTSVDAVIVECLGCKKRRKLPIDRAQLLRRGGFTLCTTRKDGDLCGHITKSLIIEWTGKNMKVTCSRCGECKEIPIDMEKTRTAFLKAQDL